MNESNWASHWVLTVCLPIVDFGVDTGSGWTKSPEGCNRCGSRRSRRRYPRARHQRVRHHLGRGERLLEARLATDRRFKSVLIRPTDTGLELQKRIQSAKAQKADVFISIHVNWLTNSRARGAEFYILNQLPPDEEAMYLAHEENSLQESTSSPSTTYETVDQQPDLAAPIKVILTELLDQSKMIWSSELGKALKQEWQGIRKTKSSQIRQAPFMFLLRSHAFLQL